MLSFFKVVETIVDRKLIKSLYTEFEGYPIFMDNDLPALIVEGMPANYNFSKPGLIVSADFLLVSSISQEFLLHHEIAQIENKDQNMSYEERERFADNYAAQRMRIDRAIEGLEGLKEYENLRHDRSLELNEGNEFGKQHANLVLTQNYRRIDGRIKNLKKQ
jgi:hypothetical protein